MTFVVKSTLERRRASGLNWSTVKPPSLTYTVEKNNSWELVSLKLFFYWQWRDKLFKTTVWTQSILKV